MHFPLLSLPNEIQTAICRQLCPHCTPIAPQKGPRWEAKTKLEDDILTHQNALAALCLTSKHLHAIAEAILYHQPHIRKNRASLLLRTFSEQEDLALSVRTLKIRESSWKIDKNDIDDGYRGIIATQPICPAIWDSKLTQRERGFDETSRPWLTSHLATGALALSYAKNVETLHLTVPPHDTTPMPCDETTLRRLKTLHISVGKPSERAWEALFEILRRAPRTYVVKSDGFFFIHTTKWISIPTKVRELSIRQARGDFSAFRDIMEISFANLKVFHFSGTYLSGSLNDHAGNATVHALGCLPESIDHIDFDYRYTLEPSKIAPYLKRFKNLKTLSLRSPVGELHLASRDALPPGYQPRVPAEPQDPHDMSVAPLMPWADVLPPSLRALSIGGWPNSDMFSGRDMLLFAEAIPRKFPHFEKVRFLGTPYGNVPMGLLDETFHAAGVKRESKEGDWREYLD